MVLDLREATDAASEDDAIRCVILTGKGKGFSAGADLKDQITVSKDSNLVERGLLEGYKPIFMNIINMPKPVISARSEEHTSELQSRTNLVCRLLLEKKKNKQTNTKQTIHNHLHY